MSNELRPPDEEDREIEVCPECGRIKESYRYDGTAQHNAKFCRCELTTNCLFQEQNKQDK